MIAIGSEVHTYYIYIIIIKINYNVLHNVSIPVWTRSSSTGTFPCLF